MLTKKAHTPFRQESCWTTLGTRDPTNHPVVYWHHTWITQFPNGLTGNNNIVLPFNLKYNQAHYYQIRQETYTLSLSLVPIPLSNILVTWTKYKCNTKKTSWVKWKCSIQKFLVVAIFICVKRVNVPTSNFEWIFCISSYCHCLAIKKRCCLGHDKWRIRHHGTTKNWPERKICSVYLFVHFPRMKHGKVLVSYGGNYKK
jgi:hypothetical protein